MKTPKRKEEPVSQETRAERFARIQAEESNRKYREFWLTLDPRDQERMPRPEGGPSIYKDGCPRFSAQRQDP